MPAVQVVEALVMAVSTAGWGVRQEQRDGNVGWVRGEEHRCPSNLGLNLQDKS